MRVAIFLGILVIVGAIAGADDKGTQPRRRGVSTSNKRRQAGPQSPSGQPQNQPKRDEPEINLEEQRQEVPEPPPIETKEEEISIDYGEQE